MGVSSSQSEEYKAYKNCNVEVRNSRVGEERLRHDKESGLIDDTPRGCCLSSHSSSDSGSITALM